MQNVSQIGKFIIFQIGDYLLALPMSDVLRVINCPPMVSGGLGSMGIVQLGHHTIRVLDLHQKLGIRQRLAPTEGLPQVSDDRRFLAIARSPQGELCGILVDEPPNLMELPLEMIRSLPSSSSQSGILDIASHVVVLSQDDLTTTIFLLDVRRVLHPPVNDRQLRSLNPL
ncbi:MAG: chemotaxis protein CheW [Coleofasciculus sp. S288]|nr:chemotaxis protein CheW [Coleofasciculus sp. S288]